MKILYDARHIENIYSGLGRYTASLLDGLIACDHLYTELLILLNKNAVYKTNPHFKKIANLNSKGTYACHYIDAPLYGIKHHINTSMFVNAVNPDIYFYPHFDLPPLIRTNTIFVVHDLLPLIIPDYILKHKFLKRNYFKATIRFALFRKNTHNVTVSTSTKKDLLKCFGDRYADKIRVVFEAPFTSINDAPSFNTIECEKPFLFYIGDRRPHKNLKKMIMIFSILKSKHRYPGDFLIAGSPVNFDEDYELLCRNMSDVKFISNLSDNELDHYYSKMDALFFLSKYEGFGLPILEAAKHNKKIISTNTSSIPEIAPGSALLLNPNSNDIETMADQINNYINKFVKIDNSSFLHEFSWKKAAEEIFDPITYSKYR